jgi:hypothetical protein
VLASVKQELGRWTRFTLDVFRHFIARPIGSWVNKKQLGHVGFTEEEESAVVAFLKTLTDGYRIPSARKDK